MLTSGIRLLSAATISTFLEWPAIPCDVNPDQEIHYPKYAYAPNGMLWWKLDKHPTTNRKFGAEQKLAAWLACNVGVGETVTMRDLRAALGDVVPNDQEHLNRRLRELRQRDKWSIPSNKDDGSLPVGTYRVEVIGWHPGLGTPRAKGKGISQSTRRRVFDRDYSRCVVCGVGRAEEYPNEPGSRAALTVGHIIPSDFGGSSADMDNLRTECKRCNEPVRQEMRAPESLEEILPDVRKLKKAELQKLLTWIQAGQRTRDRVDHVYDRVRRLNSSEILVLKERISIMVGGRTPQT